MRDLVPWMIRKGFEPEEVVTNEVFSHPLRKCSVFSCELGSECVNNVPNDGMLTCYVPRINIDQWPFRITHGVDPQSVGVEMAIALTAPANYDDGSSFPLSPTILVTLRTTRGNVPEKKAPSIHHSISASSKRCPYPQSTLGFSSLLYRLSLST